MFGFVLFNCLNISKRFHFFVEAQCLTGSRVLKIPKKAGADSMDGRSTTAPPSSFRSNIGDSRVNPADFGVSDDEEDEEPTETADREAFDLMKSCLFYHSIRLSDRINRKNVVCFVNVCV